MRVHEYIYDFWYDYDWWDLNDLAQEIDKNLSAENRSRLEDYFRDYVETERGLNHEIYLFREVVDREQLELDMQTLYDKIIKELQERKNHFDYK